MKRNRKEVTLKTILLYEAIILLLIGVALFIVETRVTEAAQKKNLIKRLDSLTATFSQSYQQTQELTELYEDMLRSKAGSIAYMLDNGHGFTADQETLELYQLDAVYFDMPLSPPDDALYASVVSGNGTRVTVKKDRSELDTILNNVYTENRIINSVINNSDLFFIVTTSSGRIVYYPDSEFIGRDISDLGITLSDLAVNDAKWLRIDKRTFYTSSVNNDPLDITISCGVTSRNMTANSHIAAGLLYAVICIIFTVVITYTYFSRQEELRQGNTSRRVSKLVARKLSVFSAVGLLLIGAFTYYVQTLFSLSMFSLDNNAELLNIEANVEEAHNLSLIHI